MWAIAQWCIAPSIAIVVHGAMCVTRFLPFPTGHSCIGAFFALTFTSKVDCVYWTLCIDCTENTAVQCKMEPVNKEELAGAAKPVAMTAANWQSDATNVPFAN